ncbi:cytidine deaminase [Kineosporia mesophila]|uniref:Cytidine deaminase n=1 Tax=Kineosporia mesophila TaxID=566012 RepID=A0ABP6ZTW1_9ACTN|nr:cytidine deaminase [Kineosporia mesophila]MCD5349846.1 cytidine deaminase [Kineosporia mesophila]
MTEQSQAAAADPDFYPGRVAGDAGPEQIDWTALRAAARLIKEKAYAPYSGFPVGAAALVDDGRIVTGCNVENASYGVGLCAECGLVSSLNATGGGRLVAFTCVGPDGESLMPCGRCRQLLYEFGGPELLVETSHGIVPMTQVLPDAFGPSDLSRATGPTHT